MPRRNDPPLGPVDTTLRYGMLVGGRPPHAIEHAAQIHRFLPAAGVPVQPMAVDREYAG